jgi:hypothetical protein
MKNNKQIQKQNKISQLISFLHVSESLEEKNVFKIWLNANFFPANNKNNKHLTLAVVCDLFPRYLTSLIIEYPSINGIHTEYGEMFNKVVRELSS